MTGSATRAPCSPSSACLCAQAMIPHHAQALDMVKLITSHTTNANVIDLAGRIQKARTPRSS